MGIDQMGAFNVAIIKERLPDGRQAVVHVEEIHSTDPFARCDELMDAYGVRACVVEQLPNFNDAMRFANRHWAGCSWRTATATFRMTFTAGATRPSWT